MKKHRPKKGPSVHARLHAPHAAFVAETAELGGLSKTDVIEGLIGIAMAWGSGALAQAIVYQHDIQEKTSDGTRD